MYAYLPYLLYMYNVHDIIHTRHVALNCTNGASTSDTHIHVASVSIDVGSGLCVMSLIWVFMPIPGQPLRQYLPDCLHTCGWPYSTALFGAEMPCKQDPQCPCNFSREYYCSGVTMYDCIFCQADTLRCAALVVWAQLKELKDSKTSTLLDSMWPESQSHFVLSHVDYTRWDGSGTGSQWLNGRVVYSTATTINSRRVAFSKAGRGLWTRLASVLLAYMYVIVLIGTSLLLRLGLPEQAMGW